jgi:hypothetical protein
LRGNSRERPPICLLGPARASVVAEGFGKFPGVVDGKEEELTIG